MARDRAAFVALTILASLYSSVALQASWTAGPQASAAGLESDGTTQRGLLDRALVSHFDSYELARETQSEAPLEREELEGETEDEIGRLHESDSREFSTLLYDELGNNVQGLPPPPMWRPLTAYDYPPVQIWDGGAPDPMAGNATRSTID